MTKRRMSWLAGLTLALALMLGVATGTNAVFPSGSTTDAAVFPSGHGSSTDAVFPSAVFPSGGAGANAVFPSSHASPSIVMLPERWEVVDGSGASTDGIPPHSPLQPYQ